MAAPAKAVAAGNLTPKPPMLRMIDAGREFVAHCILLTILLLGMKGLESFATLLWGNGRIFQFGSIKFPMQSLFDGGDVFLIVGVLIIGTYATIRRYLD